MERLFWQLAPMIFVVVVIHVDNMLIYIFLFIASLKASRAWIKHISLNLMLQKGTYVVAPKS